MGQNSTTTTTRAWEDRDENTNRNNKYKDNENVNTDNENIASSVMKKKVNSNLIFLSLTQFISNVINALQKCERGLVREDT